jgi:hypothetical protein
MIERSTKLLPLVNGVYSPMKGQLYTVELRTNLTCPEDELVNHGDTYAALEREFQFPFVPFPGLRVNLPCPILETDPLAPEFRELSERTGIFGYRTVSSVTYWIERDVIQVDLGYERMPSIDDFYAAVRLYDIGYGFKRVF